MTAFSHDAPAVPPPDAGRTAADAWATWQLGRSRGIEAGSSGSGVLPRQEFLDALNGAIRETVASGIPSAIVLIDLNNFAEINASWGPSGGDQVLAAAAIRIQSFAAERMGRGSQGAPPLCGVLDADHFAVLLPEMGGLERLKGATAELLRIVAQPFSISGQAIAVSARAAILQIPLHGRSVTTVLGRGFRLLNTAARGRPDGVAVSDLEPTKGPSTAMLERDLAAALATDQLFIALQPKVQIGTGVVQGAEALVRWQHPERGLLPPQMFIETAEKSGLIFELGLRILRDACRAGNALAAKGEDLTIAVNVSPYQLAHPDFLSGFLAVIDKEGIEPQKLEIEVTESAAMMGGARVNDSLQALRRCGIGVAIDDFGTGFSNLASLAELPADALKIDRSLVVGADKGGKAGALLDIAVQLGRTFGLSTIAEGVETTSQLQQVANLGCDMVQGYFTGRPVRALHFAEYYLRRAT